MKKKKKSFIVIAIILFWLIVIGILFVSFSIKDDKVELVFYKCVDGDTAWFYQDEKKIKVRFLGIDAPESTNYVEIYGKEASDYTYNMFSSATDIYLEYDKNRDRQDKYGRVLGWIFVDGFNLSELLVSKGYASVDYVYEDYLYMDDLCRTQVDAYSSKLGIGVFIMKIKI